MSAIQASYDTTFSTIRNVGTKDAGGALTPETTFNLTAQSGKLELLTGSDEIVTEKRKTVSTYRWFCDEVNIQQTDLIKIKEGKKFSKAELNVFKSLGLIIKWKAETI